MGKETILYHLIRTLIRIMGKLPLPILSFLSNVTGLIWFRIDKRHRTVVFGNIKAAFPGRYSDSQARAFTRKNFQHTASILFEAIWSYGLTKEELLPYFEVRGRPYLKAAHDKGGVFLLTCHMGNFELMIPGIAKAGFDAHCLYRKFDFAPVERIVREMRQRFGVNMIPLRKAAPKIMDALGKGEIVATLLDQNVDWYKGVFVDFFGRPACTNNGLAKLVLQSGATVVPTFIRKEGGTYIHEFLPPVPITVTHDPIKDIEINTQAFVSAIESMVRRCPEQYFWVHNRWKTKPYCLLAQDETKGIH